MDLTVLAIGRLKAGPERQLCERYFDRTKKAGREHGISSLSVRELPESKARRAEERKLEEAGALVRQVSSGQQTICLDESGELIGSDELARFIGQSAGRGVPGQVYVIGGPDGLAPTFLAGCDRCLSFGRFTWPHQLVRVMLSEQLYRAMTILSGHPYHRA